MTKQKLKTYAPMTAIPEAIRDNSMKLYSYLLCISGLALYPEGVRMFRQKNLNLTEIERCTGLSAKTIKLYLYELENNRLINYKGIGEHYPVDESNYIEMRITRIKNGVEEIKEVLNKTKYRKARSEAAFKQWNSREKEGVYYIKKPMPYTPIPEITLEKLNTIFQLDEAELKIYIYCCIYRDVAAERNNGKFKLITYEAMREALGYSSNNKALPDRKIRRAFYLLRGLGLIDLEDGFYFNQKQGEVPCFKLKEVYYYVSYNSKRFEDAGLNEDDEVIKERL